MRNLGWGFRTLPPIRSEVKLYRGVIRVYNRLVRIQLFGCLGPGGLILGLSFRFHRLEGPKP